MNTLIAFVVGAHAKELLMNNMAVMQEPMYKLAGKSFDMMQWMQPSAGMLDDK